MRPGVRKLVRVALWVGAWTLLTLAVPTHLRAQANASQRAFPQSKTAVEKALNLLQGNLAGRLPVLDGFANAAEHPLDSYARGYFQITVQVRSTDSRGSLVSVRAKITAWYTDPAASHSGYQLLPSNGRLEADVLDQLAEQLAKDSSENGGGSVASVPVPRPSAQPAVGTEPALSAPAPQFPATERPFSSSLSTALGPRETAGERIPDPPNGDQSTRTLQSEIDALEEVLKQQAHPKNLVAVKKSGTPVVATRSLNAKTEFLASAHDEFELLGFDADWVHVRISGLSRGWIWRNSVEMPDGTPNTESPAASTQTPVADLFHVAREETADFPGDWEPLRNKTVKIITVQRIDDNPTPAGPKARLEYAKALLEGNYKELVQKPQQVAGIVVIFDSADGGMIGATMSTLEQWHAGALSDSALWHKCFFDPPETFDSPAAPSGRR